MKTVVKLILIYLATQLLAGGAAYIFSRGYFYIVSGEAKAGNVLTMLLAMFLGFAFMLFYLYKAGYIGKEKETWSPVSPGYLLLSILIIFPVIFLLDYLLSNLTWIPDLLKQDFDILLSGWGGIFLITVLGPIFEEILFRGVITKVLLKRYSPVKAIAASAVIFGVIHGNPVQILSAGLIGLLLAWVYYRTGSLIPCILMHIINNGLSVFLGKTYPDVEYLRDLTSENMSYVLLGLSLLSFVLLLLKMRTLPQKVSWQSPSEEEE